MPTGVWEPEWLLALSVVQQGEPEGERSDNGHLEQIVPMLLTGGTNLGFPSVLIPRAFPVSGPCRKHLPHAGIMRAPCPPHTPCPCSPPRLCLLIHITPSSTVCPLVHMGYTTLHPGPLSFHVVSHAASCHPYPRQCCCARRVLTHTLWLPPCIAPSSQTPLATPGFRPHASQLCLLLSPSLSVPRALSACVRPPHLGVGPPRRVHAIVVYPHPFCHPADTSVSSLHYRYDRVWLTMPHRTSHSD